MASVHTTAALGAKVTEAEKNTFVETCSEIGTTPSNAIRMFVSAFNRRGGFPFDPSSPYDLSEETLQAIDDVKNHRNLNGPFYSVKEVMAALEKDE